MQEQRQYNSEALGDDSEQRLYYHAENDSRSTYFSLMNRYELGTGGYVLNPQDAQNPIWDFDG